MDDEPEQGYVRDESAADRLDRNYAELLQELRVAENGVLILFAFLLNIAFQQRFARLSTVQRDIYTATLTSAAVSAVLFIAPVAAHRVLFRRHRKDDLVMLTSRFAAAGLILLTVSILGSVILIVDVVAGAAAAWSIGTGLALVVLVTWWLLPARWRATSQS